MTAPTDPLKIRIAPANLSLLEAILRFRLMSTVQTQRFMNKTQPQVSSSSIATTLSRLHTAGYVSRTWLSILPVERSQLARPSAVWYFTQGNFEKLTQALARFGRADEAEDLAHLGNILKNSGALMDNTLRHELAITDFYLALESVTGEGAVNMPFWLRSSPSHADISRHVTFTKTIKPKSKNDKARDVQVTLPFNPDGFHVIQTPKGCAFYFLEMDMNTETLLEKLTNKFLVYYAYFEQKTFGKDIALPFCLRYRLPVLQPEYAPFRVLFVTPNEKRRNDLLLKARLLGTSNLFQFATLPDLLADPLGKVWLSKQSFLEHLDDYDRRTNSENPVVLRKWVHETLNSTPKHAL
jgi:hypothetical protein